MEIKYMNQLANLQFALPAGSINSYVHSVNQVPILSFDEEQRLARPVREEEVEEIAEKVAKEEPEFLQEIYADEKKFPYLNKVFDSDSNGYDHSVKLFFIDYEKYDRFNSP